MSLRTSLKKLIRRDPAAGLRERAANLQTDLARVIRQPAAPVVDPEAASDLRDADLLALQPEWEARAAAYAQAIEEQGTVSDNAPNVEAPPSREPFEQWVRLIPGWRQRTGVEDAEAATAEAMNDLCEIEGRISNMPATTLAGLKLKARVARRNEDVDWPAGLSEGVVRDILAIGEPEIEADADLLRLGRQFEAARVREKAACEACNVAQREASRHMPERPAALLFRASDHPLRLRKYLTHPDTLEGEEVTAEDIAWMRRKPYVREVRRPVRPEDNLPPGARTVVDTSPWAEAQDRADEIVAAWEAWGAETIRTYETHVTAALNQAAEDAGEAAADLADQVARLPARTAAGFQVKLRALSHYRRETLLAELPEEPDPDQILSHSLWRDVQGGTATSHDHPVTVEEAASLDFAAYAFDTPIRDPNGWMQEFSHQAIGMHVADRTLRMSKAELIAFIRKGGERDAEVPVTMLAALESAQRTFEGWGKLLDLARTRYLVAGSTAVLGHEGAADEGAANEDAQPEMRSQASPAAVPFDANSLFGMLDLASASLDDLQAVRDMADCIGAVAYAHAWGPRCRDRTHPSGALDFNAAGKLVQWIGDALTTMESAAAEEARRREPADSSERETRLSMLAVTTIDNGDPDEIEAFARELLAHVDAERAGR